MELYLSAKHKRSKLTIQDADDAVVILEGIKKLTTDHSVLIYLDSKNVVVEVDSFINALDQFSALDANRALAGAIYKQNKDPMIKVILARTMPDIKNLGPKHIDMKKLADFAVRFLWLKIELVDVILIGPSGYFSLRKHKEGWGQYTRELNVRKKLALSGPFLPDVVKKPKKRKS